MDREGLASRLKLAGRIGGLAGHTVVERLRPRRAVHAGDVPRSVAALTVEWLTAVLCTGHRGARVVGFEVVGGSDGSTSRRAIAVQYNADGVAAGLPDRVFTKATPGLTSRLITGPSGALATEVGFYRGVRPALDIEAATSYFAAFDERSCRSMLLLEDVSVTRDARFGDPVSLAVDRPMAESMVTQMAAYHAAFWQSPTLAGLSWLQPALAWQENVNRMLPFERRSLVGFDRAEPVIPPELRPRKHQIYPAFMRSLVANAEGPQTFLHSDVHLGNWYVTGAGMGQYDWQCATKGEWALDVSYALASALTVKHRQAWERDLLELYLDRLAAGGVADPPSFDDAFMAYRRQVLHGLVFWLFTIGASRMQPRMQPEHVCLANVERLAAAAADHESLAACSG